MANRPKSRRRLAEERQVIALIVAGWSSQTIARHMNMSIGTLERWRRNPDFKQALAAARLEFDQQVDEQMRPANEMVGQARQRLLHRLDPAGATPAQLEVSVP